MKSNLTNKDNSSTTSVTFLLLQIILISLLFVIVMVLQYPNPLSEIIEKELVGHMIIEHGIFFLLGYVVISIVDKLKRQINLSCRWISASKIKAQKKETTGDRKYRKTKFEEEKNYRKTKFVWVIIMVFLMLFWHIPIIFNFALYHNIIHIVQHISFIVVGICIYEIIKKFDFTIILLFFILSGGIMSICGLFFALTTNNNSAYSPYYTIQSHIDAGNSMIISTLIMTFILLPILIIKKSINLLEDSSNNDDR